MIRAAQIACVILFTALLVAVHQGFMSLRYFFSGDFPVGFIAGAAFAAGIFYLIQKLEPSSGGVQTPAHKQTSRNLIDL
jgi:hypothetical protein